MAKRRRADGTLRPCRRRYKLRRRGFAFVDPSDEDRFREMTLPETLIWAGRGLQERTGADAATLGRVLHDLARRARWMWVADNDGDVRAIAMPTDHPLRFKNKLSMQRAFMLRLVLDLAAAAAAAEDERGAA